MVSKKKNDVIVLQFAEVDLPKFKEVTTSGKKWVNFGKNNLYPDYLLHLYLNSPKHGAIVKGKAHYIAGKGFEFKDKQTENLNDSLKIVNSYGESLQTVAKKAVLDLEIFNGFFLQIIWGRGGKITDIIHLDYNKMRSDKENKMFFYKEDWSNTRGEIKEFSAFNPKEKTGSQVLYFKSYVPGISTYTQADYMRAQNFIEADILISAHVVNNANCGFTASKMISFNDGEPEQEEKERIEQRLKDKFTGKFGSKLIVNFSANPNVAPTILDLGASDLTKENLEPVDRLISQNIFTGHQVTSPMLFGVRVEGQLGGRNEMREAYEILKNTYINARQQEVEEVFNVLLDINGLPEVRFVPVEPIGFEFSESTIVQVAPRAYILEKIGINPNDYTEDKPEKEAEKMPENKPEQFSSDLDDELAIELFSQVGSRAKDYFRFKSKRVKFSSDQDCKRGDLSGYREAYQEITQLEANIIDLIRKDKRITPEVIAKALEVDVDLVKKVLNTMEEKALIRVSTEKVGDEETINREVTEGGKVAVEEKRPMTTEVFIKYSYEGPKDERNRLFCARMLELDKLYSRAEIEQISQRLGYSVWERRGGFYHNPVTGETTPYCRHYWMQHIVLKKK